MNPTRCLAIVLLLAVSGCVSSRPLIPPNAVTVSPASKPDYVALRRSLAPTPSFRIEGSTQRRLCSMDTGKGDGTRIYWTEEVSQCLVSFNQCNGGKAEDSCGD